MALTLTVGMVLTCIYFTVFRGDEEHRFCCHLLVLVFRSSRCGVAAADLQAKDEPIKKLQTKNVNHLFLQLFHVIRIKHYPKHSPIHING